MSIPSEFMGARTNVKSGNRSQLKVCCGFLFCRLSGMENVVSRPDTSGRGPGNDGKGFYAACQRLLDITQKITQAVSWRIIIKFTGHTVMDDPAFIHKNKPAAHIQGKVHFMGYNYHGHAFFCQ